MMAKVVPFILGLLVLAACSDNDSSPVPRDHRTVVPMNAEAWSILLLARNAATSNATNWRGLVLRFSDGP